MSLLLLPTGSGTILWASLTGSVTHWGPLVPGVLFLPVDIQYTDLRLAMMVTSFSEYL